MKKALFNNYIPGTKFIEVVLKEINYFLESIYLYFYNGLKAKRVLCYPELPKKRTSFYKLCKRMHLSVSKKPKRKILFAAHWENITVRKQEAILEEIAKTKRVLNINCRDISKTVVDRKFHDCFGYGTKVDPRTFKGKCLKKNEHH